MYKIIGFEIDGILTRFIPGPGDADIAGCVESQLLANRLDQRSPRDAILNYRCFTSVRSWPRPCGNYFLKFNVVNRDLFLAIFV